MPILHHYNGNPLTDYLNYLSESLNVPVKNNGIILPPSTGKGFIKNIILEEGLGIRYYNFTLKNDLLFKMFSASETEVNYKILYNLEGKNQVFNQDFERDRVLMYSSNFEKKGIILKNESFCKIAIIFTGNWIDNNYGEACKKLTNLVRELSVKNIPTIISEEFDGKSYCLAREMANGLNQEDFPPLHMKMGCITLLNDFLNRMVERNKKDVLSDQSLHYYSIKKVEERIMNCLNTALPCQEALASEFNMSVSTLKRHFRIVFGKNIYEYYQEKRMHWGKMEIEKGHYNINEIAYKLGFKKVNNFSKAFKKQFDILPRDIKHHSFLMNSF